MIEKIIDGEICVKINGDAELEEFRTFLEINGQNPMIGYTVSLRFKKDWDGATGYAHYTPTKDRFFLSDITEDKKVVTINEII